MRTMTEKIGLVELVAVGSPRKTNCEGEIMNEPSRFERHKTIRILDHLFVSKDAETGDLLARWGTSSELLRTLRPTANAGGKKKTKEPQR